MPTRDDVRGPGAPIGPDPRDPAPAWPNRAEGPDEGQEQVNGTFTLGHFQVRAIVVPAGGPDPGEGLPHFVVAMSRGHRLVVVSEGPTASSQAWQEEMRAEYVKMGRDPALLDWRIHEANVFGMRRPDA